MRRPCVVSRNQRCALSITGSEHILWGGTAVSAPDVGATEGDLILPKSISMVPRLGGPNHCWDSLFGEILTSYMYRAGWYRQQGARHYQRQPP